MPSKTISEQCEIITSEKRRGLMTHIIVWYPDVPISEAIADIMIDAGVDFLEIQIPFSDPMADGPTFMHANSVAVKNWITIEDCFELLWRLRKKTNIPLLFMWYYNSIFRYGVADFCHKAASLGCTGIIFPDYPLDHEEREWLLSACMEHRLSFIPVLNPAATEERIKKVAYLNPEMLYYGMRKGVTGAKNNLDPDIEKNLQYIERYMKIPLAVGWGISTPGHIRDLAMEAHTAIVGSKTTDVYNLNKNLRDVDIYITKMVKACKK